MKDCVMVLPLLARVVECEADPEEALSVARHLPCCTACRIVLARERRLASMLSGLDDLPIDEALIDAVMATLPAETPPRRPRGTMRNQSGLKPA